MAVARLDREPLLVAGCDLAARLLAGRAAQQPLVLVLCVLHLTHLRGASQLIAG